MPFGLNVAEDVFQSKLDTVYINLDFCTGIADNMIICGGKAVGSDHDKQLTRFLQITRQCNLRLNPDNLQFKTKQASFFATTYLKWAETSGWKGSSH